MVYNINDHVRQCLLSGMTYLETREETNASPQKVSKIALALEAKGYVLKKKSKEQRRRQLARVMRRGSMRTILNSLSDDQLEVLMDKSFDSWADAIVKHLQETL